MPGTRRARAGGTEPTGASARSRSVLQPSPLRLRRDLPGEHGAKTARAPRWKGIADPALHDACRGFPRQALHARRLAFDHPVTGARVDAVAPIPADIAGLLAVAGLST